MRKRRTFRAKMTMETQYSQRALYGSVFKRVDTIPVPMMTENHLPILALLSQKYGISGVRRRKIPHHHSPSHIMHACA
jgi:hypothetical protein